jgi:hypothetical protein
MEFSEEHCRNISIAQLKRTAELREKQRLAVTGRKWVTNYTTDEGRQLPPDEAYRLVQSGEWRFGRPVSHFH